MMSAKFWDFLTPSPPCLHLGLIYSTKFTQPPLQHLLLGQPPPPPSVWTSYMDAPQCIKRDETHQDAVSV